MREFETRVMTILLVIFAVADALFLIGIAPVFGLPSVPAIRSGGLHWYLASLLLVAVPLWGAFLVTRYLMFRFARSEKPFWPSRRPELLVTLGVIVTITWFLIILLLMSVDFGN